VSIYDILGYFRRGRREIDGVCPCLVRQQINEQRRFFGPPIPGPEFLEFAADAFHDIRIDLFFG
jgi:hypothetical protein